MGQFVTVANYIEPSEAHVVRALLESAGLPATVADEHHVTANYPISTALGGVRVQVPKEHFEVAVFLLGGASFPTRDSLVECRNCRHTWRLET